ncbi:3-hydroxyacyl-CoA dehydrogenase / enoyl-CoA hydratase / 3-hydroxybutyryl-CoA epimerase [Roseovarius nanhaiticus]|uniref:enoyl-CoA hydratase n=1 Tax=Roseovarius nanhaiticus TaxID=573024 RepID=A0A1N7ELA4_9RHOB|nr:3-hydroxyacyl-CoA dehydrogenase NAD-binding domain-containing protein [Roseovarius nanhaiticus]SEK72262.1 3-hydroxyacyl-CoA dehydrogenase / enoyl-CoA hydratase / 3-hydroxybutyryl-CoA epimerase [Roseovarius nanhaiticus]SIR88834.1 3-hydroxyacyl-CoA dehydrogenase / enoyl-CoA hydratase / 3-hydroxybutyryl-CoA epimerase [Roseovarius nanhaiticus]
MTGAVMQFLGAELREMGGAGKREGNWRVGRDADGILWLVMDCEGGGTNVISRKVLEELNGHIADAEKDLPKALVIRSAKDGGFAAGADISEFKDVAADPETLLREGHAVFDRLAALKCPTICVVHGACLGGGFELALACDMRIGIRGASFAFPEVQLGLHPGLGGTFRSLALIDPIEAMTLMLTGKSAHTNKAKKLGLLDAIVEERHVASAVQTAANGQIERPEPGLKTRAMAFSPARNYAIKQMRAQTEKKAPKSHYPAPHALIDLWEEHGNDAEAMQKAEIDSFGRLLQTDTSKNLQRAFFLRQRLRGNAKGEDGIAHVHVIGAGAMGAEIAAMSAIRGKRVTLGDTSAEALGRAIKLAGEICGSKHLSSAEKRDALDRLMPDPDGYGITSADLVIEAGPEKVEIKAKIYDGLKSRMKDGAILASNTSSLSVDELAHHAHDAARFAGLHFFNPVSKIDLVEVIKSAQTSDDTAARLAAFCGAIKKRPVHVADYPGFLVNRALVPYMMEAMTLLDEGVPKETIDTAALRFGMPMGPVTLADQVGLDIGLHVALSLSENLDVPLAPVSDTLRDKVAAGEIGKKAGKGFYDWSEGTPHPSSDEGAPEDLTDRLILPMLNACAEVLRKDIVEAPDDIDAAMIFATGWAPFRGGPMHYARARGIDEVVARLRALEDKHGARFAPDAGWEALK